MSMFVRINSKLAIVAIWSVTAEALVEMDTKVDVTPKKHMFEETLVALAGYWNANYQDTLSIKE